MRKSVVSLLLLVAIVASGQLISPAGTASADIRVVTNTATNQFPNGIRFDFFFESDRPVTDIRLRFRILPDGVNATVRPECTEGRVMNCQAIVGNVGQTYMVPGAEIVYSWQITDDAGERFQSDEAQTVYQDTRFDWESVSEDNLTVYYYFGDEQTHRSVLNVAKETVDRFSGLLNTSIDFPVKIWVYRSAQDLQPAVASRRGQGNDNSIRTLGEVGASDTALVSRDTEFLDIVRHELAHVVTRAGTRTHLVDIPIWINEGISSYAQNNLLPNEAQALSVAIQRNSVLPITSLGVSARGTGGAVSLFYAQSGSIIGFMVEVLGEEKFGEFVAALARDTVDGALGSVYGLDLLGLENAWRLAVGLPEFDPNAPTPATGQSQSPSPTATPRVQSQGSSNDTNNARGNTPAASSSGSDGGVSTIFIALGALVVVFVGLLAAAGFLAMRSRGSAP
jgi:hypothetical protein